jgi:hypothetical protein
MPRAASFRGLLAAALVVGLAACVTPSVPIPPPEAQKISFEVDIGAGAARFQYAPHPDFALATVYVLNRTQGVGVITTAQVDGSVAPTEPFAAALDDEVVVSFEKEGAIGSICVRLQPGQSGPALQCQ